MPRSARALVAGASLLMAAAFFLPLWRVSLFAPQYPEGLGMLIRINTVVSAKEHDLQNINGLNKAIGMRRIEPDAIPELRFMPALLGALLATGLAVAAWGRRSVFAGWAVGLGGLLAAGLFDYWRWGYAYGHDLNPHAALKIPGMSYEPPLLGSRQLLNFTAHSWPASGGWLLVLAAILVGLAAYLTFARKRRLALFFSLVTLTACGGTRPVPISLGEDGCDYCRMAIVDSRFGGEAVTRTGRAHKFDSIECLAAWARTAPVGTVRALYVIDLQHPGTFVAAEQAGFLRGGFLNSPMGRSVVAFATPKAAEEQRAMLGGRVLTWADVLADTSKPAVALR